MMAKFKVGDNVRVIDKSEITFGGDLVNGKEYAVVEIYTTGSIAVIDDTGDKLCITTSEFRGIKLVSPTPKYTTEKRKANVGERILITNAELTFGEYSNGEIFTVSEDCGSRVARVTKSGLPCIFHTEYEVIVDTPKPTKPTKSARITALESQVAELTARVTAMEVSQLVKPKPTLTELLATYPTPNEQRKAVIERAKVFVKDTINEYQLSDSEISFVIDEKKRSVSVTLSHLFSRLTLVKAIAKCDPSDVFNADIGKAIALGRALGLDVTEFTKAVQPTELVPNMRVIDDCRRSVTVEEVRAEGYLDYSEGYTHDYGWGYIDSAVIIDDTEAQY